MLAQSRRGHDQVGASQRGNRLPARHCTLDLSKYEDEPHVLCIYRRKYRTKVQVNRDVSHAHAYLGSAHAARGGTPWQKKPVALAGTVSLSSARDTDARCARGRAAAARPTTRDATVDKIIARPVEVPDITRMHRYISVLTRPSMLDHRVQRADRIVVMLPASAGLPRATRPRQNTAKVVSGVWTERGPGSRITIMRTLPRVLCTGFGRGFPCCTAKQRSPRDSGCHESP